VLPHRVFDISDPSLVGDARRAGAQLADQLGYDEVAAGRLALVITELGTNLARHAREGQLLLGHRDDADGCTIEVVSLDRGPGMADLARCLVDGYSTGGTSGSGLGAVRRLSDRFDAHSTVPGGTVIAACIDKPRPAGSPARHADAYRIGALAIAAPGEVVCGDAWAVAQQGAQAAAIMADGLGHGSGAATASDAAIACFRDRPFGSPSQLLERAHALMRATRGAAATVVQLDGTAETITFCGAGNITGRLISGVDDRTLLSQHGTVGLQIRRLQDVVQPWPAHALLVLHSDGIATRWRLDDAPGLLLRDPLVIAGWLMREHRRGRDDATVVVLRRA
jgi:anti-sigma regulatory factor (Ser/Thr protein kinase)